MSDPARLRPHYAGARRARGVDPAHGGDGRQPRGGNQGRADRRAGAGGVYTSLHCGAGALRSAKVLHGFFIRP